MIAVTIDCLQDLAQSYARARGCRPDELPTQSPVGARTFGCGSLPRAGLRGLSEASADWSQGNLLGPVPDRAQPSPAQGSFAGPG